MPLEYVSTCWIVDPNIIVDAHIIANWCTEDSATLLVREIITQPGMHGHLTSHRELDPAKYRSALHHKRTMLYFERAKHSARSNRVFQDHTVNCILLVNKR